MLRRIHITNAQGRDASVAMAYVAREEPPPLGQRGRPVSFRRYVAAAESGTHQALVKSHGEDYASALIEGDPEVDLELVGRAVHATTAVYLSASGEVMHAAPREVEVIYNADGTERERRASRDVPANVHDDLPLRWTGRKIPVGEATRRYAFRRTIQLHHVDGLSYDYLHAIARELASEQVVVLMGGGARGSDPIILEANGRPYRGFLSGRIDPEDPARYKLFLHLSDMELRPAPTREEHAAAEAPTGAAEAPAAPTKSAASKPAKPAKPAPPAPPKSNGAPHPPPKAPKKPAKKKGS